MDVLGSPDVETSQRIGRATYGVLYAMANAIVDSGTGVVVESNFDRERSGDALRALAAKGRAVFVQCDVDPRVARDRYAARTRHPGHHDAELLARWDGDVSRHAPPDGIPALRVDTSAPVDARALAREIRRPREGPAAR
jgi:predicted kinase